MYDIITIDIDQWVHAGHNARRYTGRGDNGALRAKLHVRLWHKADMLNALANVRFWGQSGQ
jgi:hypothetical protein